MKLNKMLQGLNKFIGVKESDHQVFMNAVKHLENEGLHVSLYLPQIDRVQNPIICKAMDVVLMGGCIITHPDGSLFGKSVRVIEINVDKN